MWTVWSNPISHREWEIPQKKTFLSSRTDGLFIVGGHQVFSRDFRRSGLNTSLLPPNRNHALHNIHPKLRSISIFMEHYAMEKIQTCIGAQVSLVLLKKTILLFWPVKCSGNPVSVLESSHLVVFWSYLRFSNGLRFSDILMFLSDLVTVCEPVMFW